MNLTTTLLNSLQKKIVKYLLLFFLLIILINNDLLVLEGGNLPKKIFSDAHIRPGLGEPGYKVSGNSNSGKKFGNDLDDFNVNNVKNDDIYNEGNKETGKTESSKSSNNSGSSNLLTVVVIAVIISIILSSIYAWYKRRNRDKNLGTLHPVSNVNVVNVA
jgi:hypothetical protein